jgi:acetyltransferase
MVEQGVELIVGATLYPGFGMLVAVGLGGTLVEVIQSASVELAPITEQRALAMLDETPAGKLIRGVRRKGPYDLQAAIDAIVVFSQFAARSQSAFKAIEVNPLIVLPVGRGVVGVDAVFER